MAGACWEDTREEDDEEIKVDIGRSLDVVNCCGTDIVIVKEEAPPMVETWATDDNTDRVEVASKTGELITEEYTDVAISADDITIEVDEDDTLTRIAESNWSERVSLNRIALRPKQFISGAVAYVSNTTAKHVPLAGIDGRSACALQSSAHSWISPLNEVKLYGPSSWRRSLTPQ